MLSECQQHPQTEAVGSRGDPEEGSRGPCLGRHTLGAGRKQVRREDLRRAVQLLVGAFDAVATGGESRARIQIEEG